MLIFNKDLGGVIPCVCIHACGRALVQDRLDDHGIHRIRWYVIIPHIWLLLVIAVW